jgi:gas vesicle structural protein
MTVERSHPESSVADVLDRVLDKGIVIDAWIRLSLVGIELLTVDARVVVASIATHLQYADVLGETLPVLRSVPQGGLVGRRLPAARAAEGRPRLARARGERAAGAPYYGGRADREPSRMPVT